MPPAIKQLFALWKGLGVPQKALVLGLVLCVAVGVAIASFVGAAPSYVLLKSGLDASAVSDSLVKLGAAGVRRKVGSTGSEILVDARDFDRARNVASEQKLFPDSASDPEWEAAASAALGLTEEQRRRRDLLAKQKTLSRTLEGYEGVERATVTLTPAVKAYSRRDSSPAKAALVLKLREGFAPDGTQVESFQRVIAAALADLLPENVAVSDTRGQLLSRGSGQGAFGAPAFQRRREVERHLVEKAQSALDAAFGRDRAHVRVDATLDVESTEETKRAIDPETKVLTQEKNSTTSGAARAAGGTPGVRAATDGTSQGASGGSSTEETSASYDYARTETVKRRDAGEIKRLTVAVALDASLAEEVAKVKELVSNAVGAVEGRDAVSVALLTFAAPIAATSAGAGAEAEAEGFDIARWLPIARTVSTAILGLGLAWWALRAVKGAKAVMAAAMRESERPAEAAAAAAAQRPMDPKQRVAEAIHDDPQAVGALLKSWLYEGAGAAAR